MSDTMKSIASKIRKEIRHLGLVRTACRIFMEAVNVCFGLRIIRVFKKEIFDPDFLESNEAFQYKFLDESQMFELARNPDNHLTEDFVRTALEKGDECYGGFDGEALACFCWYSNKPTDDEGLTLHFGPDYYYGYAGFTHPKYRGRRLSTIRGNRARREHLRRGFKGEVFTINFHNFRSLRSASASSGLQDIGYVVALKIGKHAWIHNSRGCREHGVYLAKPAAAVEPVPAAW
jgi:hypothetical protein